MSDDCNPIEVLRGPKGEKGDTGDTGPIGPSGVDGWALNGNTNAALKYIGTNDNYDFPIYTNGTQRAIVLKTGQVGIGTAVPATNLEVTANGANSIILSTRYSADTTMAAFVARKSRGTLSAPSAVLVGDYIGGIGAIGYHSGGAFATTSGEGRFYAAENFTNAARGTNFGLFVAPIAGTVPVEKFTVANNGDVTVPALSGTGNRSVGVNSVGKLIIGTDLVLTASLTIATADVLQSNTTSIEIIATPGVNKAIQVLGWFAGVKTYTGIPYATNTNLTLIPNGGATRIGANLQALVAIANSSFSYGNIEANNGLTIVSNTAIHVKTATGNPTAGNSDVVVYVTYKVVSV